MSRDLLERVLRRRLFDAADLTPGPVAPGVAHADPSPDLGRFALVERIGQGGMGEVWKAWSKDLRRHVAIKFVRGHDAGDEARFMREARIAAGLNHPGIVPVHDVGRHEGRPYIVMPLLEGRTVDRAGLDVAGRVRAVRDAALALDAAHRQGVIHRDVKPTNVMVCDGRVHVMDFGVARLQRVDAAVSHAGSVIGTPPFMSPEQARGAAVDARSDVYSLGATLYALLTGAAPFESENLYELLRRVGEEEPRPPAGVDRDLATVVLKCLEKDPARRYASAIELAEDLDRYLAGEPVRARRAGWIDRAVRKVRKHRWIAAACAALVVVLGAVGVWALVDRERRSAREAAQPYVDSARKLMRQASVLRTKSREGGAVELGKAREELKRALAADPEHEEALVELGRVLVALGEPQPARESFMRAAALAPRLASARLERALLDLAECDAGVHDGSDRLEGEDAVRHEGALRDLAEARSSSAVPDEVMLADGLTRFLDGKYAEAAEALREYAKRVPGDARSWKALGHALLHAREWTRAAQALDEALALAPGDPSLLLWRGQARAALARRAGSDEDRAAGYERAIEDLDGAAASGATAAVFYHRAAAKRASGDVKGCVADYTRAIDMKPGMWQAYNNRGTARRALGDTDGALADYDEALRLNPRLAEAYVNRGTVYRERKDYDRAMADYDRALEADPARASAWNGRALVYLARGDREAQLRALDEAIRLNPRSADAYGNRGQAREALAKTDAARRVEHLTAAAGDYERALEVARKPWSFEKMIRRRLDDVRAELKR